MATNNWSGTITVLMGDGSVGFGSQPRSVAIGDVNGDVTLVTIMNKIIADYVGSLFSPHFRTIPDVVSVRHIFAGHRFCDLACVYIGNSACVVGDRPDDIEEIFVPSVFRHDSMAPIVLPSPTHFGTSGRSLCIAGGFGTLPVIDVNSALVNGEFRTDTLNVVGNRSHDIEDIFVPSVFRHDSMAPIVLPSPTHFGTSGRSLCIAGGFGTLPVIDVNSALVNGEFRTDTLNVVGNRSHDIEDIFVPSVFRHDSMAPIVLPSPMHFGNSGRSLCIAGP